jgi:tripartite-type tricarboxylate transporter receptor subunit TctC
MLRRHLGRRAALALPALAASGRPAARADGGGAATLLVGAAPGGEADRWARSFAPFLERHWPRTAVAVRNHPGGGLAAARLVAEAPPDGRVIGAVSSPLLLARAVEAGAQGLFACLFFLAAVAEEPLVLVGHPGQAADLESLRGLGPGATLGTPPPGSAAQLAALAFRRALPLHLLAFPNAAAARQAVLAGHIPCALLAASEAIAALRDGRLAGIAVAQARRSTLLPEVPTLAEGGIPLELATQRGFILPAGCPPAVLEALGGALRSVVADPEFADQAEAQGFVPRHVGPDPWDADQRRATASLELRWMEDPWVPRNDQ